MTFPTRPLNILGTGLALTTGLLCLLFPRMDGDAAVYALLAKHMVLQGDAFNLVFQGKDWLDKPHFPFWMMAIFFKLFGINEYAYHVPGLLFYGLGAWFTRKIALHFYDEVTASFAVLIYLSLFGLLLAVHDQKAEVYLLALMTGASYAWLRYEQQGRFKYWLLGCVCTAAAVMTKGVFVLGILGVGLVVMLVYRRAWSRLFHWKWVAAIVGTLLFTLPELLALYLQFDAHPEKLVFDRTHVSGLKFFLWDSQFGRFLNTGPIQNTGGSPFFFVHNLVWTFFPLSVVLMGVLWTGACSLFTWTRSAGAKTDVACAVAHDVAPVFLWSTFLSAFVLFSATKYQMDYYLVIVFPYAAIACAHWLKNGNLFSVWSGWLVRMHLGYVGLILALTLMFAVLYFWHSGYPWVLLAWAPVLALAPAMKRWGPQGRVLVCSLGAVLALFAFTVTFHRDLYVKFNMGHVVARYLNAQVRQPVFVYNMIFNTFDFFSEMPSLPVHSAEELLGARRQCCANQPEGKAFYVVIRTSEVSALVQGLEKIIASNPGGDGATATPKMQVKTMQQFEEIELPKQFVWQLVKDDKTLPRQSLSVLRVEMGS